MIINIQAKIKSLEDTAEDLKKQANIYEVNLEKTKNNLLVASVKDQKFIDDIKIFADRLNSEQPKLIDDNLNKLRVLIVNIKEALR
jgi:hypothetical protein